ncbi:MAG: dipeptide epimerase [Chitinophagia bacterium]|jgi:L-Ala-D/L-Glu epimerase
MKITATDIYLYKIPMTPFTIATGTMYFAQNILIKIHTDEGIIGLGECSAFPMIVGETQLSCYHHAKDFATYWKGKDPLAMEQRLAELSLVIAGNYTIKSAFDMALYDIAAKAANLPLFAYLGGKHKAIETDLTIGIDSPENMALQAIDFVKDGVKIIKVKLGKDPIQDVERIQQIRKAIGDETKLRIDANQGWAPDKALKVLEALAPYNIEFCEQPMHKYFDDQLPALCKASPIKIMADESVFTHHDARKLIQQKACHSINIKFAKSGGIHEALKIHDLALAHQMPCMMGGMLESRLALSAKMHFAMAKENIKYYDMDTCLLGHLEDPVTGGVQFNGMHLTISDAIGIGADVDPAYLAKLESCTI